MLEVSDSLILAQQQAYYPITKQMYDLSGKLGDGLYVASALGVWTMILLTLTILSANALAGEEDGGDLPGLRGLHHAKTQRGNARQEARLGVRSPAGESVSFGLSRLCVFALPPSRGSR